MELFSIRIQRTFQLVSTTLQNGGTIDYVMGDKPNKNRGIAPEDASYSFSRE